MIPITALLIPIVAILTGPFNKRLAMRERREARQMYERIVMEKLDVIKTAIAMGQSGADLKDLDQRLANLIGSEELAKLLDSKTPNTPEASTELRDAELSSEIHIQQARQRERG